MLKIFKDAKDLDTPQYFDYYVYEATNFTNLDVGSYTH
jgi:hypothetical protein